MNKHVFTMAGVLCLATVSADAARRYPNIILINADDLGYGDVACYGQKLIKTPHIDQLAREGTRFTDCYVGSPVCGPSRTTMLTGKHAGHAWRRHNRPAAKESAFPPGKHPNNLPASEITMATMLRKAGYVTGGIGKWGLGEIDEEGGAHHHGFDFYYGFYNHTAAHSYYPPSIDINGKAVPILGNQNGKRRVYIHDRFEEETLRFILENKEQPFFLYLPYTLPHSKYEGPGMEPYADRDWPEKYRHYAAMITRLDDSVGNIMNLLKELELDHETLVLFTSDNGPSDQNIVDHFKAAGPLRGYKRSLYEGGIRVPMIVRWPGKVPAARESDFVWYQVDLMKTFAELTDAELPPNVDGISVLPTLLGRPQVEEKFHYWEFYFPFQQAVRMDQWKGIRFGTEEPLKLYNLSRDVAESNDVAAQHPEIVEMIKKHMKEARHDTPFYNTSPRRQTERGNRVNRKPKSPRG